MRERERITSLLIGTLPPTSPVFPPCGTIGIFRSQQCARMRETSCVLPGRSASLLRPRWVPVQSVFSESRDSRSVTMLPTPTMEAKCCTSSSQGVRIAMVLIAHHGRERNVRKVGRHRLVQVAGLRSSMIKVL